MYFWTVNASDNHDAETSSSVVTFYTDAYPEPPLNFATISPGNNTEGLESDVQFLWVSTTDPDPLDVVTYNLVYATDWSDSATYTGIDDIVDTTITVTLDDNMEYYWIVEAVDKDLQKTLSDDGSPNRIVVGTLGIDGSGVLPTEYAVHQNYPNPFNPVTTLRYDLPEQAHVKIIVYDMLGRKVGTILDQTQDPGFKSLVWDATNDYGKPVSAGIYLYQIQAGEFMQTKKMVLLK